MDRIVTQPQADELTATTNPTRLRLERRGRFPQRFQITQNGKTGYRESEINEWIAGRAADRAPTRKTTAATAATAERRRVAAGPPDA